MDALLGFDNIGTRRTPPRGLIRAFPSSVNNLVDLSSEIGDVTSVSNGVVEIILPEGDYRLDTTINVLAGRLSKVSASGTATDLVGAVIRGSGRERSRLFRTTTGPVFRFYSPTGQMLYTRLEGFSAIGPGDIMDTTSNAFQFGGVESARSNILSDSRMEDVLIRGFHSCTRHDDNTQFAFRDCFFQDFLWGSQLAYNCDIFKFENCSWGDQGLGDASSIVISCSTTNGSPTVSGISAANIAKMKRGQWVMGANIPANTIITAVGASSITLNNNATATGATTIELAQGIAIATQGTEGGTYRPTLSGLSSTEAAWRPPHNTNAGSQNSIVVESSWLMRLRSSGMYQNTSASQIVYRDCYSERGYRFLDFGITSASNPAKNVLVENHHFSQASVYRYGGVIDYTDSGSNNAVVTVRQCRGEEGPNTANWLKINGNASTAAVEWDRNDLPAPTGGVNSFSVAGSSVSNPTSGHTVKLALRSEGNYIRAYSTAVDGNTISWDALGIDGFQFTLAANGTINNPTTDAPSYKRIRFMIIQTAGGHTCAMGNKFLKPDGTAIGTIASGTAGQRCLFEVIYDGNGHYIAQTVPVWV